MNDPRAALDGHCHPGHYGRAGVPGVILSEVKTMRLLQLAAWPDTLAPVGMAGAKAIGATAAPGPGMATTGGKSGKSGKSSGFAMLRVEPLKWLLAAPGGGTMPEIDLAADQGAVLDLSHSRAWLTLSGDKATRLLNGFLPIDLRAASFADGAVATTSFHHTGATLWRAGGDYHLLLARGFAVSLWEVIQESALQYGLEIRPAARI